MTEKTDNLETQLDALADQCADDGATGAPVGDDAATAPADDLAGSDFADQVQKMLDEATANLEQSGVIESVDDVVDDASAESAPPTDGPAETPAAPPSRPAPVSVADEPPEGDDPLIHQIDSMLADAADDALAGDFEAVEDIDGLGDEPLPADPDSFTEPESPDEAEPRSDADADLDAAADGPTAERDDHLPGDFDAVEPDTGGDGDDEAALSEGAAAVAAELDADAALRGDFDCPSTEWDDQADDDEPVIETAGGRSFEATERGEASGRPAADRQARDSSDATIAEAEPAPPPPPLIAVMATINQPIEGLSEPMKNAVGVIAIGTLGAAMMCFLIALLGPTLGTLLGGLVTVGLTLAAFYALFVRRGGSAGDETESI